MNAIELSREYFNEIALPRLRRDFPADFPKLAAGLIGNGSECFGYDDELSRDHDWGVDFYIWTDDSEIIPELNKWKLELFEAEPPEFIRTRSEYGAGIGAMTCGDFYKSLIGSPDCPNTLHEWLRAPEENYALAVNGEVFYDGSGNFTGIRERLLGYYPEDIRKKKLASRCMALAQTGQYNHQRTAKRGDYVTLRTVLTRFSDSVIATVFLLNRVFRPYYKWAYRAMSTLPILGTQAAELLLALAETEGFCASSLSEQERLITKLCTLIAVELRTQKLVRSEDWFLTTQGEELQAAIKTDFLRSLPAQYEIN